MIDKKESSTGSSETFITGSAESINDTIEKISNGVNEIRTENITLVNHRHQHFYGDPNAKLNNISDDNDTLATITKITLGGIAIFGGIKLISSGGNDMKRIEEEKQKAIEMKENKEIKIIALNNEDKYSWYKYDNKTLKECFPNIKNLLSIDRDTSRRILALTAHDYTKNILDIWVSILNDEVEYKDWDLKVKLPSTLDPTKKNKNKKKKK